MTDHNEDCAPLATVERIHADDKRWKEAHGELHRDLDKSVGYLTNRDEQIEARLRAGAGTMAKLTRQMSWPVWKVLGYVAVVIVPVFTAVGGLAWSASRYPTREELQHVQHDLQQLNRITDRLSYKLGIDPLPADAPLFPMAAPPTRPDDRVPASVTR